ncbi:MAG: tRNA dihydrouridine synthase DusB [Clostridia bacterium]|nr:tRNA dihydrouridine synthase DusB [Clostridia bacterium]
MKIQDLNIKGNIFLAPMAGITDLPFRTLCYEKGCSFAFTEMISAKGIYYNDKKTKELMERGTEEPFLGVQIFGSDPKIMAYAVDYINQQNIDLIDINMGCPAPKIVKNKEGSALLKNPSLIGKIVKACVNISKLPITVKVRLGYDQDSINVLETAKIIEQNGAHAITIHGRTREMFYSGISDWDYIKQVKEIVSIPVIGNGDVSSVKDYTKRIEETNCDGIMIGRAAQGNPWIFEEIEKGERIISLQEKINMINRHYDLMVAYKGEERATLEMRKHVAWYLKGEKHAAKAKDMVFKATNMDEMRKAFQILG